MRNEENNYNTCIDYTHYTWIRVIELSSHNLLNGVLPYDFPKAVDDEEDSVERSNSSLSAEKAWLKASLNSRYRFLFLCRSSGVSFPKYASCDKSSASMILLRTSEHRGKKRLPSSTAKNIVIFFNSEYTAVNTSLNLKEGPVTFY